MVTAPAAACAIPLAEPVAWVLIDTFGYFA